ncbi:MAG: helix-turn-helix transcriptional regulator [Gordonibacter sp.]|uniref:helix-turn-helix domain-containing protein n=1 Tax=Gordonibacter sp. TaxID=1968902 RepID=UPI002FC80BC8
MANNDAHSTIEQHEQLENLAATAAALGRNVTRLRKRSKITKQRFAMMVDIGRPFLNRLEDGTADPRLSIVLRLADALGTTPQELLTDHDEDGAATSHKRSRHARL